jgi:pimeloyl-ACP methyl ester carboxylesterase
MAKDDGLSDEEHFVLDASGFRFDGLALGPREGALVLLLHGFPQFADWCLPVMQRLAEAGYRAVAVDQRGYSAGARPLAVEEYALPKLVADALGFADALGAARFHLVGHDWGGAVAWACAAAVPQRLHSVSVLSTPHLDAFAAALRSDPKQMALSLYMLLFKAPGHLAEKALLAADAAALRGAYKGKVPEALVERNVRRMRDGGTLTAALNWYRATSFQGGGAIGKVEVPTLYMWGDQDQALGETAALATAAEVTGPYRFERLEGKSHWLIEECPDESAKLLLEQIRAFSA